LFQNEKQEEILVSIKSKNIKRLVINELKREFPQFKKLTRKQKKKIVTKVLKEVHENYDKQSENNVKPHELLNIQPIPENVITLEQMEKMHSDFNAGILPLKISASGSAIIDDELTYIYDKVDWAFLNSLLAPSGYSASQRKIHPVQYFRAELLKSLKYPEITYRKFCEKEINNKERKENRAFIGLKRSQKIAHGQLSTFRSSLSFEQMLNVMVYFIYLFIKTYKFSKNTFYGVDSTELAAKVNPYPLAKLKIGDKKVRIYSDLDVDCGSRRSKRDKSKYVVGYRLHTLTIIDGDKGVAFPLLNLLAPANHHDSHFLEPLVEFGKKIGLDLNIVVADQAYSDNDDEPIQQKHHTYILNEPKQTVNLPKFVTDETYEVYLNQHCETPLKYMGYDETIGHEFHCNAAPGECPLENCCQKFRYIPRDAGVFGHIPYFLPEAQKMLSMRKVIERPFNLLKHREGLEPLRVYGHQRVTNVATIANIATLLIEMAGFRKKKTIPKNEQLALFKDVA
jgi:hypothetical protein